MDRVQQIIAEAEAKGERWHVLYRLLAFTGLRIGEALALEWWHIDLVGRRVRVEQTTTMAAGGLTLGPPKSEKGNRAIPIDDALVAALLAHREAQDAVREQAGARYARTGLKPAPTGWSSPRCGSARRGGCSPAGRWSGRSRRTGRIPTPSGISSGRRCSRRGRPSCGSPGSWATPTSASPRPSTSTPTRPATGRPSTC